jgi:hypothetical protein
MNKYFYEITVAYNIWQLESFDGFAMAKLDVKDTFNY